MNGRVRELMIRAISDVDSIDDPETRRMYIPNCFAEKFAELIIEECIAQIEIERANPYRNMGDVDANGISACVESIRRIKEHFGVEE